MAFDQEIADIRLRIAAAVSSRDRWRAAGKQAKYFEAYCQVDVLELELDRMRRQRIESAKTSRREAPAAEAGGPAAHDAAAERERLMAELAITFDGTQYQYSSYRYDRLDDAVNYARKQRAAPPGGDAADSLPPARLVEAPDELERKRMTRHGITFKAGVYYLGPYRYDRLADAMRYARLGEPVRLPTTSLS